MSTSKPSNSELQVLGVLWDHGPSTVREVMKLLPDGKERAYTTVLTILQGLEKKKLVAHTAKGNAHVFHATKDRERVVRPILRQFLDHVFKGSASAALQHMVSERKLAREEIEEIRRLADEAEKRSRKKGVRK